MLLLTDQRTDEKKAADAIVEAYRHAFPKMIEAFERLSKGVFDAGQAFASWGEIGANLNQQIAAIDHGEYIMPKGRISFPALTGRAPRDPEMQPIRYTARVDIPIAIIDLTNVDYSEIEARLLRKREFFNEQMMVYALGALHHETGTAFEPMVKEKAVKQNGRSASYLDHDPTKKHKRRRK